MNKPKKFFIFYSTLIVTQIIEAAPPPTSGGAAGTALLKSSGPSSGPLEALLQASFVVQLIILILLSLSILCWAIGWSKYKLFQNIQKANLTFDQQFWRATSLDELFEKSAGKEVFHQGSSHARVFKAVYLEMKKLAESPMQNKMHNSGGGGSSGSGSGGPSSNSKESGGVLQLSGLDNLERSTRKAVELELADLESRLPILATTGSTGPFIGLFGTVWGIMGSFQQIGRTGSASLAAVAPGISEALITTAIGLAAAIPAVVTYNYFVAQIRRQEISLNNFSSDLLNIVKRNFFRG